MSQVISRVLMLLIKIAFLFANMLKQIMSNIIPYALKEKKSVRGEIVLVTGGGSGFGRLLAIKFAQLGAKVVIWDVNEKGNEETCQMVKEINGQIYSYILDVSDKTKVYETAELVKNEVGEVSILVNNAGIAHSDNFLDTTDVLLEKVMGVNAMAHFWTLKAFLPSMVEKNHGHIVCVSSVAGLCAIPRGSAYSSSKHAVIGLMDSITFELIDAEKTGIKTTIVCPYFSRTALWEGKYDGLIPLITPETVAEETIKAVLTNKEMVFLPKTSFLTAILKFSVAKDALHRVFMQLAGPDLMQSIKINKVFEEQK